MRLLLLLPGRCGPDADDIDARLLGRLLDGSRELDTPNESRLTPACGASLMDEAVDACEVRFLVLLTVTVLGT